MAHAQYPHLSELPLSDLSLFLRFQWSVRRGDLRGARAFAAAIAGLTGSANGVVGGASLLEARLVWAQLRHLEAAWADAFDELEHLTRAAEERRDAPLTVRCLLLQASIRMQAADPLPQSGAGGTFPPSPGAPSASAAAALAALPFLLKAHTLATRAFAPTLTAALQLHLARVHLALGRPRSAVHRLRAALPQLVEHAPADALVDALYTLAVARMQEGKEGGEEGGEGLREAAEVLELALQAASALQWRAQCLRCSHLLARVYHERGEVELRDAMAHRFLVYHDAAATLHPA